MRTRVVYSVVFLLVVFALAGPVCGANQRVFGPEDFTIGRSRIHLAFERFLANEEGGGTIVISKNTPQRRIRRGLVLVNGQRVPLRRFLRGNDLVLEEKIFLRPRNFLLVFLTGARGASLRIEVTRKAEIPPPEVSFSANPQSIKRDETSTLTWNTEYADAVSIEPEIGSVDASGSWAVTPTETTPYTLTALGPGGTTSREVTVTVYQPPSVTIRADPESIFYGDSSTLSWESTDAIQSAKPDCA
ncbi:MAG: hypothetical protein ACLFVT_02055 [Syntrophobacteria bacterium]